jgi:hypothetical protein
VSAELHTAGRSHRSHHSHSAESLTLQGLPEPHS